jgi:hypothetical protein
MSLRVSQKPVYLKNQRLRDERSDGLTGADHGAA